MKMGVRVLPLLLASAALVGVPVATKTTAPVVSASVVVVSAVPVSSVVVVASSVIGLTAAFFVPSPVCFSAFVAVAVSVTLECAEAGNFARKELLNQIGAVHALQFPYNLVAEFGRGGFGRDRNANQRGRR